jgi:leucyl aminopeptidase
LALSVPPSPIAGEVGAVPFSEPDGGVWITLGSDAFATLTADGDLRYGLEPLRALAERSGVVLTRVAGSDIERVSGRLHQAFRRCPGFIVHDSIVEALSALAGADRAAEPIALSIDQGPWVERLEMSLGGLSILGTIQTLSTDFVNRYYQDSSGVAAAQWIHDQWQTLAAGHPEVTVELYGHSQWAQPSVILAIPGTSLADEVVVLGGHLDSISPGSSNPGFLAPGADDNASGIAVLTAVIRAALQQGFRPQRTVQFMGYAAEEVGLEGSGEIAAAYDAAGVDVVAVLQLDMTGYQGSVEDIGLIGDHVDPTLTNFVRDLVATYQPELTWVSTTCGYACSDHASWTARGFAAAMPFESRVGQHNPEIHTTDDTLATLGNSAAHALKFARLAAAFLVEVAKPAEIFADGFESGTTDRWTTTVP